MRYPTFKERPDWWELTTDQHPLKDQLVFFGGGRHPGTTRYHDSSLYGYTGTLTSMDPATDWVFDSTLSRFAVDCDGSDDSVRHPTLMYNVASFSVAFWVKTADTSGDFIGKWDGRNWGGSRYAHFMRLSSGTLQWYVYRSAGSVTSSAAWTGGTGWAHCVGICNGVTQAVYVNGVQVDSDAVAGPYLNDATAPADMLWGIGDAHSNPIAARIADPMYWSRALSTAEIDALRDPGNVMLAVGGNPLLRYRRKWWPVSSGGAAATTIRWPWQQRYKRRMAGA